MPRRFTPLSLLSRFLGQKRFAGECLRQGLLQNWRQLSKRHRTKQLPVAVNDLHSAPNFYCLLFVI